MAKNIKYISCHLGAVNFLHYSGLNKFSGIPSAPGLVWTLKDSGQVWRGNEKVPLLMRNLTPDLDNRKIPLFPNNYIFILTSQLSFLLMDKMTLEMNSSRNVNWWIILYTGTTGCWDMARQVQVTCSVHYWQVQEQNYLVPNVGHAKSSGLSFKTD